jgi:enamine deaminase RidA (YjgF/YER057c/UK114 family)
MTAAGGVRYLNPDGSAKRLGTYSHVAVAEAGRLAFIAGQVAVDADGQVVGAGDVAAQVPVVFDHVARLVAALGATPADICEFTTYLVGEDAREPWFRARTPIYQRLFPDGAYPPNTLLIITGLARPEFRVEISAVVRLAG